MHFRRNKSGDLVLSDIHPLFAGLLAEIPRVAARHEDARARLYPAPLDPDEPGAVAEVLEDWDEHVRPGLEHHFAASRETVAADLGGLDAGGASARCVIPRGHFDAWLNALNQARLILAGENGFEEGDLSGTAPPDLSTRRGLALLKVHFYAHLQELLVGASD